MNRLTRLALIATAVLSLTACSDSSVSTSTTTSSNGRLTLKITDAPVDDAAELVVVFTGVELQPAIGDAITINLPAPRSIDLLQFRNGATTNLVEGAPVPAGVYSWLRLRITAQENLQSGSYIKLRDGRQFPLFIPSASESGLKLVRPFVVAQGSVTSLIIDFDLRKSVVAPPGQQPNWFLRPALRLIDELQVGTLTGSINIATLAAAQQRTASSCKPAVYVYAGSNAVADDMDGSIADGADPIVYGPVAIPTEPGSLASYTVGFLESGAYTVAATCFFEVDADPTVSEFDPAASGAPAMIFARKNASISANTTARVDFP